MKTQSLADFNPYLKGRQSLVAVFARTVESSTAIEGVHLKLGEPKPTRSPPDAVPERLRAELGIQEDA